MAQVWKCSCGLEVAPDNPLEMARHVNRGRKRGQVHNGIGLFDTVTGEIIELALAWKCACGAKFGPTDGLKLTSHVKHGRGEGETHNAIGLVDTKTGEVLAKVVKTATALGLISYSEKYWKKHPDYLRSQPVLPPTPGSTNGDEPHGGKPPGDTPPGDKPPADQPVSAIRGRFFTREVELDGRLLILYDVMRQCYPDYQVPVGEWILQTVLRYYCEHSRELRFGQLFVDVVPAEAAND